MAAVEPPSRNSAMVSLVAAAVPALDRHEEQHRADRPRDEGEREDREGVERARQPVGEREEQLREDQHRGDAVDEEVEDIPRCAR